ncbi:AI-2E family transporter [Pelomonas sp. P7]|uniref:AI-2E family transporter n=1 Tax=Pelomonas caseinilytica TaxID=2906763 RepID=A0ABS8X711_9BURK|nr:AI-2E family transporter [Pelomonas sp. P7]MCE4536297.1 AI-2E family transporter [Pelomonas sp. P7]
MTPPPAATPPPRPPRSARALRGLFLLALVFAVREARPLLAPVMIAVMLTFTLAPAVRWLRARGVPAGLGALLLVMALLLGTVSLATSLARPAAAWWEAAPTTVAQLIEQLEKLRAAIPGLSLPPAPAARPGRTAAAPAAPAPDALKERLASEGVALTGMVLARGFSFLLSAAATVILTYFLLASEHWLLSRVVEAMPRRRTRALLLGGVRAAQREISSYLAAVGIINSVVGVITAVVLWLQGLPNPTLWGAITALLCFVPYLGPMSVMVLLLLAGIGTFETGLAVFGPTAAFMAIHAIESNIVSPLIVGRRLSLSTVSVFLSVMFWGWLWGIAGALIAVPLLIALRSLCRRTRGMRLLRRFLEGDHRERPPSLRSLLRRPPVASQNRYT